MGAGGNKQHTFIARTPSTRQNNHVDNGRNGMDSCSLGRDDKRRLRSSSRFCGIQQCLVVGRHEESHHEDGDTVEQKHPDKDSLCGLGDVPSGSLRLGCNDGDIIHTTVSIRGIVKGAPETQEATQGPADTKILHEGAWMAPVSEAVGLMVRAAAAGDYQGLSNWLASVKVYPYISETVVPTIMFWPTMSRIFKMAKVNSSSP